MKVVSFLLSISLTLGMLPIQTIATENTEISESEQTIEISIDSQLNQTNSLGEIGGYLAGNVFNTGNLYADRKFTQPTGFGFAAERGNNLADRLKGLNASVIGDSFEANGADRKIVNRNGTILIQTKYYQTASESVGAAFDKETGLYRYLDGDGKPMQLEVPKDQRDAAVKSMRKRIENGKVPGVTNPDDAEKIVRPGSLTFEQAKNIAEAGNIDSLKYDATNGVITASCVAGISFVIDYACCVLNGQDSEEAVKNAGLNGIKTGGIVFATYVISSQLAKTGMAANLSNALIPTAEAITKIFGDDVCKAIMKRAGVEAVGKVTAKQMADVISRELIADGVMLAVLTSIDVAELFRGRISKEEVLKNLTVTVISIAAGTAGGYGGAALGGLLIPGVGPYIGATVGAMLAGGLSAAGAEALIAPYYESDAEEMFNIISEEFTVLCGDYLINEEEGIRITEALKGRLIGDVLKEMYASENRNQFARDLMEPLFAEEIKQRAMIITPTEEELRYEMKQTLQGVVFVH